MQQPRSTRRALLAPLALYTILGLAGIPAMAQNAPVAIAAKDGASAQAAAQRDFAQFAAYQMRTRPGIAPADFPLDIGDMQDLKDAVIGYGFPVHTVEAKDIVAGRTDLQAMAKPTGQWRFVVSVHGKPVGLATVEQVNGRYETVAYGAATLAKDVEALTSHHGNAARSNVRFVRIYQARADFLEVSEGGRTRYAPLHSARESLLLQARSMKAGQPDNSLMEAAEVLQPLRAAVKANLDAFR
jgi:hypothetical protein